MNRYISADELLDRFCGTYECDECESYNDGKCTELVSFKKVRYIISKVPTADVAEVRCGDKCGKEVSKQTKYCHDCGAQTEERKEE